MKYLTIDTSFMESIKFDFDFILFRCLDALDYKLIISEVIDGEIKKHLLDWVKPLKEAKKYISPLSKVRGYVNFSKLKIDEDVLSAYQDFKIKTKAEIIPVSLADSTSVFNDYFLIKGAFGNGNKKFEFPDAFAISSILKYIKNNDLIVLSNDSDWKRCFDKNDKITFIANKAMVIKQLCSKEAATDSINRYITLHKDKIVESIEKEFSKFIVTEHYYDQSSDVDDSQTNIDVDVDSLEPYEIIRQDDKLEAYLYFNYEFNVVFMYDDYDNATYDKEDDEWYNIEPKTTTINGTEVGYIHVSFEYKENEAYIKSIKVLDSDFDFWMHKDKYDISESDTYSDEPFLFP